MSRKTSRHRNSSSLMFNTAIDGAPTARLKGGETDIFKLDGTDICTLGLHRAYSVAVPAGEELAGFGTNPGRRAGQNHISGIESVAGA